MPLPGKLSVGILEEDNPQESYFRYKPILIESDGSFVPFLETDLYPDVACLRIVPDKNESSHFKARMRRIGRYCAVDLRAHPGESDKIRLNKNYKVSANERNMYILYSDVVREPNSGAMVEVLDAQPEQDAIARLPIVAVRREDGGFDALVRTGEDDSARYVPDGDADLTRNTLFDFDGASVLIAPPEKILPAAPEAERPVPERVEIRPAPEVRQPEKPEIKPGPKPWICHDNTIRPNRADPRQSPREQSLSFQTGFNPRRGRSLQEIIDDQWRHSRIEQLGHPIPGNATCVPRESPVDSAVNAVRAVWDSREARQALLNNLSRIEGFSLEMASRAQAAESERISDEIGRLEETKTRLLDEVEALHEANMRPRGDFPAPDAETGRSLIARVKAYFAAAGCPRSESEISLLLAAAAIGRVVIFTGAAGSGAGDTARLLAQSLGWPESRLFSEPAIPGEKDEITRWQGVRFVENANTRRRAMEYACELSALSGDDARVWISCQDNTAGFPIGGALLEQAILLRLPPESADAPFAAAAQPESAEEVSPDELRRAFAPDPNGASAEIAQRLKALRNSLSFHGAGLSRAVLDDLWWILAGAGRYWDMPELKKLDLALSIRAIPGLLATLPLKTLVWLPDALADMPKCQSILQEPVALDI